MNPQREDQPLRVASVGRPVAVDRKAGMLRGYVVAQLGPFKSPGRGEFDVQSLEILRDLGNAQRQGVKSRFSHPTECDDGLGKFLGRARNFELSETITRDGKTVPAVRADLHFDATALDTPVGGGKPLGEYVLDLAESDPDALSSSVVIRSKREYRLNSDGTRVKDPATGEDLPPLWRPFSLWATDVVDTGDAVDGILSGLPNGIIWKGAELLDSTFPDLTREELSARLEEWLQRYLSHRFGPLEEPEPAGVSIDLLRRRQRLRELETSCAPQ
jgi:hypothetical protein